MSVRWRAGTALAKGIAMGVFGLLVLAFAMYRAFFEQTPDAAIMGGVGFLALAANGGVAWMLFKYRAGDSNMRSVWLCSRNDAIANIAVLLAASGVWATGTGWPDLAVGVLIAGLALGSGLQVVIQARQELATA
jgi:Co/Zn/Cd efflux system component